MDLDDQQQQPPLQPEASSQTILSEEVTVNGVVTPVTMTADGKLQWTERGRQRCLAAEKEVLGFVIEGEKVRIKAVVENEEGICCVGSRGDLVRKDFVFEPMNKESLRLWSQHLRDYLDSLGRPKRLFVFVNPFGGKKSASNIFSHDVKPLLEDAGVQITVQETKHQLHAKEVVGTLDLSKYDGIVCVSGDGVLVEVSYTYGGILNICANEAGFAGMSSRDGVVIYLPAFLLEDVVNGLLEREDWSSAIKMPLGMVPAGTGNGMVKSLLDAVGQPCKASNAILAIIRGHKCSLDIATILQGDIKFFSVLMLAWGLVADIDIESEKYRWMGKARMDFYALQRIFNLRRYNGSLSFVPAPGFEGYGEPTSYNPDNKQLVNSQHAYQGPDINLTNLDWRTVKGPFVSVWLHNVPWGGEDAMAAPDAKFSDGYMDLILIRECPKFPLISLMTELNTGGHVKSPHVMYLKVKAFILEPGPRTEDSNKGGIIDVDGEVLARGKGTYRCDQKTLMTYDKLQITIDQGLGTLFAPL